MNQDEIAALTRLIKAICPAQKFDEYTPDAWLLVLDDVTLEAAVAALKPLARTHRFIAPADIAEHIRTERAKRPDVRGVEEATAVPDADPDDPAAYIAALRSGAHRPPGIERPRPVAALLAGAFPHVPAAGHS